MTIAVYSDLQTAVGNWLHRTDLSANIPDFITLAEARIAFGSQEAPFQSDPLRIRAMETDAAVAISARTAALPTGFLKGIRFYLTSSPYTKLDYVTPDHLWGKYGNSTATGCPKEYTLEGDNLVFGPIPDGSYTGQLLYHKQFDNFANAPNTNWLLTNNPGVYLWGTMLEAWTFAQAFDKAEVAHKKFVGAINALNLSNKEGRFSAGPWQARTDIGNP